LRLYSFLNYEMWRNTPQGIYFVSGAGSLCMFDINILSKQIPIFPVCEESLANDFSPR
jgi:uncharacterized membrane protein YkgB